MSELTEHQAAVADLLRHGHRMQRRWKLSGYTRWRKVVELVGPTGERIMTLHGRTVAALEKAGYEVGETPEKE